MIARISFVMAALLAATGAAAETPDAKLVRGNGVTFVSNVDREMRVDMGTSVGSPDDIRSGLFPEELESPQQRQDRERCERLIAEGFKCMPPSRSYTRFNLPGVSFRVGSAELPDLMKQQLRAFADALRGRSAASPMIRIDGHADATGNAQGNLALSQQRAESVRDYLVSLGVSAGLLSVQGYGANQLRNPTDPAGAENRRVEIARALPK